MKILGIETSCDETSVALLDVSEGAAEVKKEVTASQVLTHAKYGGVVPEVAARKHIEALPVIVRKMRLTADDVDGIAVTRGPGLITSLRVGVDFARSLAYGWDAPLVGINHIEGHIAANFVGKHQIPSAKSQLLPAVVLVVSGGHTELILMKGFGKYERLGATRDDAAGEAFDKVAKMMDLGYPGGPAVSKRAAYGDPERFDLPRPMLASKDFDFSFSGLKTAVLYALQGLGPGYPDTRSGFRDGYLSDHSGPKVDHPGPKVDHPGLDPGSGKTIDEKDIDDMCASFEEAVVEVLVKKTLRAVKKTGAKTVMLAGGVAANRRLREDLVRAADEAVPDAEVVLPDLAYTTDNAAMIAMAGWFRRKEMKKTNWKGVEPDPQWKLGDS